jgi:hypothetical protein
MYTYIYMFTYMHPYTYICKYIYTYIVQQFHQRTNQGVSSGGAGGMVKRHSEMNFSEMNGNRESQRDWNNAGTSLSLLSSLLSS